MLEFNSEHKSADLQYINLKNKKRGKVVIAGILLSAVILFSGCAKVSKDSTTDLNRALVSIGDEHIAFDINFYNRWSDANIELKLADGTTIHVHPSDVRLYNNKSETMKDIEDSISSINTYDVNYRIDDDKIDRALIQVGDEVTLLEISSYNRWSDANIKLKLADGTTIHVHPMDLILFNSESAIMSQVQEQLFRNNSKTR